MIKNAVIGDLDILNELNKEVQNMHFNFSNKKFKNHSEADMRNLFQYFIEKDSSTILIKYLDNKALGYLIYEIVSKKENYFMKAHSFVYIHHISIEKIYTGRGFAFELFNKVIEKAKEFKIENIELDVWTKNKIAKKYFKKLGFETYNEKMELKIDSK